MRAFLTLALGCALAFSRASASMLPAVCEDFSQSGCVRISDYARQAVKYQDDRAALSEIARTAGRFCTRGSADGCAVQALALSLESRLSGNRAQSAQADVLFKQAAEAGSAMGWYYQSEEQLSHLASELSSSFSKITAACQAGDPDACLAAAALSEQGFYTPKDHQAAASWRSKACRSGGGAYCEILAEGLSGKELLSAIKRQCDLPLSGDLAALHPQGYYCGAYGAALKNGSAGAARSVQQGQALLRRACMAGNGEACFYAADRVPAARDLLLRGCALGDPRSCAAALPQGQGSFASLARLLYVNPPASFAGYIAQLKLHTLLPYEVSALGKQACDAALDDPFGRNPYAQCALFGERLLSGEYPSRPALAEELGRDLSGRACKAGSAAACLAVRSGVSEKADAQDPVKSCKAGSAQSCGRSALAAWARGERSAATLETAERGCLGGDYLSCYVLGFGARGGWGGKRDPKKAFRAFVNACLTEDNALFEGGAYCDALAFAYLEPLGVRADPKQAWFFGRRSCDTGSGLGCAAAGHAARLLGEKDLARSYFSRACSLGNAIGCEALH